MSAGEKQNLRPQVFIKAANRLIQHSTAFACLALEMVQANDAEFEFFAEMFKPRNTPVNHVWWKWPFAWEGRDEVREARILALLLCAEMLTESEVTA